MKKIGFPFLILSITSCSVGPDYVKPDAPMSSSYKEFEKNPNSPVWKVATPQDDADRGPWWEIFKDAQLNGLVDKLNTSNQSILAAEANYRQAQALVGVARAAYFPTISADVAGGRQEVSEGTVSGVPGNNSSSQITESQSASLTATWELDVWGSVRRSVEASKAGAEASSDLLASTRLSSQGLLAQSYFQLQALDASQEILDEIQDRYAKLLQITENQYASGTAARADILQAQSLLQSAQAQAISNGIARAQTEHAIAVLVGEAPGSFTLSPSPLRATPPVIPVTLPSTLLERRPDVAQAERLMAQANAQIGVATAAYYPSFSLSASGGFGNNDLTPLFYMPLRTWSLGAQATELLFNGGAREAQVKAARAAYDATVANYRQTVLSALQSVEDNLVALRILYDQSQALEQAVQSADAALQLVINQYKAGTVSYASIANAEVALSQAQENLVNVQGLRMSAAVGLVKALGGGWESSR